MGIGGGEKGREWRGRAAVAADCGDDARGDRARGRYNLPTERVGGKSSNLLEAELRAAFAREGVEGGDRLLTWITWVLPDRPLSAEVGRVLRVGSARGADAWHLACALYLAEDPADLPFFTLDARQAELAGALGFPASG